MERQMRKELTPHEAKFKILTLCRKHLFDLDGGRVFFYIFEASDDVNRQDNKILAIGHTRLYFLHEDTKEKLSSWKIENIQNWDIKGEDGDNVELVFKDNQRVEFKTYGDQVRITYLIKTRMDEMED